MFSTIRDSGELSDETEDTLKSALEAFKESFQSTVAQAGSEAALGATTKPDEVKPDVGWDRMSSADDDDDEAEATNDETDGDEPSA